jgi:hypothetical protein
MVQQIVTDLSGAAKMSVTICCTIVKARNTSVALMFTFLAYTDWPEI